MNKSVKLTIAILVILLVLFIEAIGAGFVNSRGNSDYIFSSFGAVPKYVTLVTQKNGLEVTGFNPENGDVTIYSYSDNSFSCMCDFTYTYGTGLGSVAGDIYTVTFHNGENIFKNLFPTSGLSQTDAGLDFLIMGSGTIYRWKVSEGIGNVTYHSNPLYPDETVTSQNGYTFSQNMLSNTFFYYWLPTLIIVAVGFSAYRIRKWVKEVNKLKAEYRKNNSFEFLML